MALIVVFTNTTALADVSSYKVHVLVGDGTPERSKTLFAGTLDGHRRADGWAQLIKQFIDTYLNGETP